MYSNIENSRCCKFCPNYKSLVLIHCITQIKHKQLLIDQTGDFMQEKIQHLPVIMLITFYSPSCLGQKTAKGPYQESLLYIKSIVSFHITINTLHMMK